VIILLVAFTAVYWAREVVVYGKLEKFTDALPLILPIVFAYVFYSFVDLFKSSVLVPARMTRELTFSFVLMLAATVTFYFGARMLLNPLTAMAYAMCFGTATALLISIILSRAKLGEWLFTHEHYLLLGQAVMISFASTIEDLPAKLASFILFTALYIWAVKVSNFLDFKSLWQKYLKRPL
jgi:hypothetical protein